MEDDAAVTKERTRALDDGQVRVDIGLLVIGGDGAVLAAQVADLASRRLGGIAWRGLTTDEWIEVGKSLGAVAIFWNRVDVEVIGWMVSDYTNTCRRRLFGTY